MKKIRLEDDFYLYKNGQWLEEAVIPNDKPLTGSFVEIMLHNEKILMEDLKTFALHGVDHSVYQNELFDRFILLYKQGLDQEKRDLEGNGAILKYVEKIQSIASYQDLEKVILEFIKTGLPSLLSFGVQSDMKNASVNTLYLGSPGVILPDKTYYDETNPAYQTGQALFQKYQEVMLKLFEEVGIQDASKILENTLAFDQLLVPITKSSEEKSDYLKMYNPYTIEQLAAKTTKIQIKELIRAVVQKEVKEIIVTNPKFVEELDGLVTDRLELIKSWLISKTVYSFAASGYGSDRLRLMAAQYGLLLTGQKEPLAFEKFTFNMLSGDFQDVVGLYFGKRYFGDDAKKDVEDMVKEFIEVYKKRLKKVDWLSKETIDKAIIKLSKIHPMIGYPTKIDKIYEKFIPNEKQSFIENLLTFSKLQIEDNFSQYGEEVDKTLWHMGAHVVNAYYEPMNNQIVFPAGILQKPFYAYDQSKGENYGGIGAVIAHEITHAFDTNGARIDEFGNINNWWKDEDFKAFNERAEAMVSLFDGLDIPGSNAKCNGKLTVTENIADAAGLSCAYEAGMKHQAFNPDDFFSGWAHIWRFKANPSYMELLANVDVHAPGYLRGVMQLKNFRPFAEYYKIKKEDGMYIDPSKQVSIW